MKACDVCHRTDCEDVYVRTYYLEFEEKENGDALCFTTRYNHWVYGAYPSIEICESCWLVMRASDPKKWIGLSHERKP